MSEAKFTPHAPTPWKAVIVGSTDDSKREVNVCVIRSARETIAEYVLQEDAEFIVQCVNAHDDLLAALQAIIAQYDAAPDGPLGKGFTNGPFLDARAAIALALGKESESEWTGDNAIITSPDGPNECTDCDWIGRTPSGCPKCGGSVVMRDGANHG